MLLQLPVNNIQKWISRNTDNELLFSLTLKNNLKIEMEI